MVIIKSLFLPIFFLLFINESKTQVPAIMQDSLALVDLYDSTNGNNWTNKTGWLTGPVKNWFGIQLNSNGFGIGIGLHSNGLTGNIPASIGNFSQLQALTLGSYVGISNQMSGTIPST